MSPPVSAAAPARTRADPAMVEASAPAHRRERMLDEGRCAPINEVAAAERTDRGGHLGRVPPSTPLAPDIVEAILDGRRPAGLGLPRLPDEAPADWSGQR